MTRRRALQDEAARLGGALHEQLEAQRPCGFEKRMGTLMFQSDHFCTYVRSEHPPAKHCMVSATGGKALDEGGVRAARAALGVRSAALCAQSFWQVRSPSSSEAFILGLVRRTLKAIAVCAYVARGGGNLQRSRTRPLSAQDPAPLAEQLNRLLCQPAVVAGAALATWRGCVCCLSAAADAPGPAVACGHRVCTTCANELRRGATCPACLKEFAGARAGALAELPSCLRSCVVGA